MTIAPLLRKVMVVDDLCDARAAARRALEEDGFSVIEAAGGAAAIAALEESNPDLVILPVNARWSSTEPGGDHRPGVRAARPPGFSPAPGVHPNAPVGW
ncbi:MAG: response regulator [Acidimicrobiia bacterium]